MDEALTVGLAKCFRRTYSDAQEPSQIDRLLMVLLDYPIQRFTTWILKNEDGASVLTSQLNRLGCPCRIEFGRQRVFMFEPPDTLRRRLFSSDRHCQNRHLVAAFSA